MCTETKKKKSIEMKTNLNWTFIIIVFYFLVANTNTKKIQFMLRLKLIQLNAFFAFQQVSNLVNYLKTYRKVVENVLWEKNKWAINIVTV